MSKKNTFILSRRILLAMLFFFSLCVAAIDFGSSDSGCAFSMRSDYKLNPLNIHREPLDGKGSATRKSPTIVLMNPAGQFAAFGEMARQQYEELANDEKGNEKEWFYFRRFKMQLYTKKVLRL